MIKVPIFLFRTKLGQERSLARLVELKASKPDSGISCMLISDSYPGYCFIEGENQQKIEMSIAGIRTISGRAVQGKAVPIEEMIVLLNPKPSIEGLETGDIVEIIDGPFKGLKARITRIEAIAQEVTAELLDSTMALPVKIHADYVKKIRSKAEDEEAAQFGKFSL